MDATDGLAKRRSELGPDSGREVSAVAAPAPFLCAPVPVDVADVLLRRGAESALGLLDYERPSCGCLEAAGLDALRAVHEADDHAGLPLGGCGVEHHRDRLVRGVHEAPLAELTPPRCRIHQVELHDRPAGELLRQVVARAREGWVVDEASGERGRDRDDRSTGANLTGLARDDDSRRILGDRPDRPSEADRVAEVRGEPDRRLLQSAIEPVLLRPTLRVHERVPAAAGADVEEHVQKGEAGGLGREQVRHGRRQHGACARAADLLVDPGFERNRVERARTRSRPGFVERDRGCRLIERSDGRRVLGEVVGVIAVLAADASGLALLEHHVLSGGPLREGGHSGVSGQFGDVVLPGADPLAAQVDCRAGLLDGVRATADAIACLEHDRRAPMLGELPRGRQAGVSGTDDDDVKDSRHGRARSIACAGAMFWFRRKRFSGS